MFQAPLYRLCCEGRLLCDLEINQRVREGNIVCQYHFAKTKQVKRCIQQNVPPGLYGGLPQELRSIFTNEVFLPPSKSTRSSRLSTCPVSNSVSWPWLLLSVLAMISMISCLRGISFRDSLDMDPILPRRLPYDSAAAACTSSVLNISTVTEFIILRRSTILDAVLYFIFSASFKIDVLAEDIPANVFTSIVDQSKKVVASLFTASHCYQHNIE